METKVPIYKQRGKVLIIKDRWWRYRIMSACVCAAIGLIVLFIYVSHSNGLYPRPDPILRSLSLILFFLYGVSLVVIETKRVFSNKKS